MAGAELSNRVLFEIPDSATELNPVKRTRDKMICYMVAAGFVDLSGCDTRGRRRCCIFEPDENVIGTTKVRHISTVKPLIVSFPAQGPI